MLGIVLAAGKGTRMKSDKPKVLFEVCGASMVNHIISLLNCVDIKNKSVIYGYKGNQVIDNIQNEDINYFEQKEQLGTGHAVKQVNLDQFEDEFVFIMPGDVPLLEQKEIKKFIKYTKNKKLDACILTTKVEDPTGYGRIVRNDGLIEKIVEQKDATVKEIKIDEINTGVYIVKKKYAKKYLNMLDNDNNQNEYYLTDIFKLMISDGLTVSGYEYSKSKECIGVNSRYDLCKANEYVKNRKLKKLMDKGVTINNPSGIELNGNIETAKDVVIESPIFIRGDVKIEKNSKIGPFVYIEDSVVKEGKNMEFKYIKNNKVKDILLQEGANL